MRFGLEMNVAGSGVSLSGKFNVYGTHYKEFDSDSIELATVCVKNIIKKDPTQGVFFNITNTNDVEFNKLEFILYVIESVWDSEKKQDIPKYKKEIKKFTNNISTKEIIVSDMSIQRYSMLM